MISAKWVAGAIAAIGIMAGASAAERLDKTLEEAAKCSAKVGIAPSMAAYRLLLSSKVVAKERKGPLTFYLASVDRQSNLRLWGVTPTRIIVAERDGVPNALIGSLYSKDFPMSDQDIVGSFQGGLKRKITLAPFSAAGLASAGVAGAAMSTEPVANNNHLMAARLASGERLVLCGTKQDFQAFLR